MKKGSLPYNYFVVVTVVFTLFATGCSKSSSSTPTSTPTGSGTGNQSFTCKISGASWTANTAVAASYVSGNVVIAANATNGTTGEMITLYLINVTGSGTFTLAGTFGTCYAQYTRSVGTSSETFMTSTTSTGSVTITTLNTSAKNIIGTFSFTAKSVTTSNTISATNGSFNVIYQ